MIFLVDASTSFTDRTSLELMDWLLPVSALAVFGLLASAAWYIWNRHVARVDRHGERLDDHGNRLVVLETTNEVSGSHKRTR